MNNTFQMTRRMMLTGAAVAGALTPILVAGAPAAQAEDEHATPNGDKKPMVDISKLPREKIELVKPPFVHAHDQRAQGGPTIKEFTLTIRSRNGARQRRTEVNAMTSTALFRTPDGRPSGRLRRTDAQITPTPTRCNTTLTSMPPRWAG